MIKRIKLLLKNKHGLTLVETLVALTILALLLFCITPIFVVNLGTIRTSGDKAVKVYRNAGIMQKILGNFETGDDTANAGYDIDVASATITLSGNGNSFSVEAQGDLLVSNPNNIAEGYATVKADSPDATFQVFPKSLTDDFKEAYITVAAIGFSFVDEPGSSIYELYCNKDGDPDKCTSDEKLIYGQDYIMRRVKSDDPTVQNRVMQIILYGGTDVNFSNSPLTFKYKSHKEKIQVDAPSMIMVGEKSKDGYRYYVTRGETEKDSDGNDRLIVLQKNIPLTEAPLTSAMNDVAWVSAEDADKYAVGADGEKYGYYVMCGDNGQIRRFWQNPTTGNYYWGGDHTLYTDITYDQIGNDYHVNTQDVLSTSVSYKFMTRRQLGSNALNTSDKPLERGFNVGHRRTSTTAGLNNENNGFLRSCNVWTYNAFDGDSYYYAPDGVLVYYKQKNPNLRSVSTLDTLLSDIANGTNGVNQDGRKLWNAGGDSRYAYDMAWLSGGAVSQEAQNTGITLTSVGSILLTGSGAGYETNARNGSHELPVATLSETSKYPTETYTLYAGYIPAAMDLWASKGWGEKDFKEGVAGQSWSDGSDQNVISGAPNYNQSFKRTSYNANSTKSDNTKVAVNDLWSYWKGNYGLEVRLTDNSSQIDVSQDGLRTYSWFNGKLINSNKEYVSLDFYAFKNVQYVLTGKYDDTSDNPVNLNRGLVSNICNNKQMYSTNGREIDVTVGYLSNPFAVHFGANPIDSKNFPVNNDKINGLSACYWNNRKETVTFLDIASTVIPCSDDKGNTWDIPVSLAVGYVMGGIVEYEGKGEGQNHYSNAFLDNGIVYLRAGTSDISVKTYDNLVLGEYSAIDNTGYKLDAESNYFHQFYYLNSKITEGKNAGDATAGGDEYQYLGKPKNQSSGAGQEYHTGDMYGAKYWQNNRHIKYISIDGGEPDNPYNKDSGSYSYLRCHPLSDAKVTCVAWGTTWDNNPEAMWGTDNGTVLGWWVDLNKVKTDDESQWNDKSVCAEFQSYQWIDNCTGKTFAIDAITVGSKTNNKETVGAHWGSKNNYTAQSFNYTTSGKVIQDAFRAFYDKGSRTLEGNSWKEAGFVSTLSKINDITYANDYWVAVGNQATGKSNLYGDTISPALYCGNGSLPNSSGKYYGGSNRVQAYTGNGQGGSWINVRYWYDAKGTGKQSEDNAVYLWKAVKISDNPYYNIVQINCLNGIWFATGYEDSNQNGEWDEGERAVVCWARDPLAPCDGYDAVGHRAAGRWSENTQFYRTSGMGEYEAMSAYDVGGINSVACRDDA